MQVRHARPRPGLGHVRRLQRAAVRMDAMGHRRYRPALRGPDSCDVCARLRRVELRFAAHRSAAVCRVGANDAGTAVVHEAKRVAPGRSETAAGGIVAFSLRGRALELNMTLLLKLVTVSFAVLTHSGQF